MMSSWHWRDRWKGYSADWFIRPGRRGQAAGLYKKDGTTLWTAKWLRITDTVVMGEYMRHAEQADDECGGSSQLHCFA